MGKKDELEKGFAAFYPYENVVKIPCRIAPDMPAISTADKVCKRLFSVISDYERKIDAESEVGIILATFGAVKKIVIESIGWIGSELIEFVGYAEEGKGEEVRLIQHVSQLNFLLCSVPKESDRPRHAVELRPWDEKMFE